MGLHSVAWQVPDSQAHGLNTGTKRTKLASEAVLPQRCAVIQSSLEHVHGLRHSNLENSRPGLCFIVSLEIILMN